MQLGQILDKRYERPKSLTAVSEEPGAKSECLEQKGIQCTDFILNSTKRVGKTSNSPLRPTPGHTPALIPYKETAHTPTWEVSQQRNLVFALPCCSRVPSRVLAEFLVWSLIRFYWLEKAKNPGWYQYDLLYCVRGHKNVEMKFNFVLWHQKDLKFFSWSENSCFFTV